ncbi:MAG: nucleotidyltransferase domain-containing protein [Verrucomicrobiae bacterium]|nr:nucleotidyltransferase domain-containing protein [Verrucomicrobiae bacterium]
MRPLPNIGELKACFRPVFERYHIQRAILFGSFARGDASARSDIDLLLVQETDSRFFDRLDGLLYDLNIASPGPAVEALVYTPQELERMSDRPFIAQALREGVVIYESNRSETERAPLAGHRAR